MDSGKFAELAQAELARIRAARHVLLGAAQARNGLQIEVSAVLEVNVLQPDIPQPLQSKFDKKVWLSWFLPLSWTFHGCMHKRMLVSGNLGSIIGDSPVDEQYAANMQPTLA